MTVDSAEIVRELSRYFHQHPDDRTALAPVWDAARDHSKLQSCTHQQRCPLIVTGAVVVDEQGRVLCLRDDGRYALAEAEPEDQDDTLSEAALRLLAEEAGVRDVWTDPALDGPFLVDVAQPGQHRYGARIRVGIRYLFWAHSGAVLPAMVETGTAAWIPLGEIGIPAVRDRVGAHLIGML